MVLSWNAYSSYNGARGREREGGGAGGGREEKCERGRGIGLNWVIQVIWVPADWVSGSCMKLSFHTGENLSQVWKRKREGEKIDRANELQLVSRCAVRYDAMTKQLTTFAFRGATETAGSRRASTFTRQKEQRSRETERECESRIDHSINIIIFNSDRQQWMRQIEGPN